MVRPFGYAQGRLSSPRTVWYHLEVEYLSVRPEHSLPCAQPKGRRAPRGFHRAFRHVALIPTEQSFRVSTEDFLLCMVGDVATRKQGGNGVRKEAVSIRVSGTKNQLVFPDRGDDVRQGTLVVGG